MVDGGWEAAGRSRSGKTGVVSRRMERAAPAYREQSRVGGGAGCAGEGGGGPHLRVQWAVSLREVPRAGAEMGEGAKARCEGPQIRLSRGTKGVELETGGGTISNHPSSCVGL